MFSCFVIRIYKTVIPFHPRFFCGFNRFHKTPRKCFDKNLQIGWMRKKENERPTHVTKETARDTQNNAPCCVHISFFSNIVRNMSVADSFSKCFAIEYSVILLGHLDPVIKHHESKFHNKSRRITTTHNMHNSKSWILEKSFWSLNRIGF